MTWSYTDFVSEGCKKVVKCKCGARHTIMQGKGESSLPNIIECCKCEKKQNRKEYEYEDN